MVAATAAQVTAMLEVLGAGVTWTLSQIGSVIELVLSQPILLIPVSVTLIYTLINVFRKIF